MKPSDFLQDIGRPMAYYPKLRKVTGSTTATIMLCNLIYWRGKESGPDGWLYKTADEIENETGLSYREQQSSRKQLVKQELVEERYQRLDHKMYFRVNLQVLDTKWSHCFSRNDRSSVRETTDRQFDETTDRQFDPIYIEYTSTTPTTTPKKNGVDGCLEVMDLWNKIVDGTPFPKIIAITGKRKKDLVARLKEPDFMRCFEPAVRYLLTQDWFCGRDPSSKWVADFDYMVREGIVTKHFEKSNTNKQEPTIQDVDMSKPWNNPDYVPEQPMRVS